jgi:hypothetical protein
VTEAWILSDWRMRSAVVSPMTRAPMTTTCCLAGEDIFVLQNVRLFLNPVFVHRPTVRFQVTFVTVMSFERYIPPMDQGITLETASFIFRVHLHSAHSFCNTWSAIDVCV